MIRFFPPGSAWRTSVMSVNDFNIEQVPAHAGDSSGHDVQDGAPPSIAMQARPSSPLAGPSGLQSVPSASVAGPPLAQGPGSTAAWGSLSWLSSPPATGRPATSAGWQGALGSAPSASANQLSAPLLCSVPREGLVMPSTSQAQVPVASGAVQDEGRPAPDGGSAGRSSGGGGPGWLC